LKNEKHIKIEMKYYKLTYITILITLFYSCNKPPKKGLENNNEIVSKTKNEQKNNIITKRIDTVKNLFPESNNCIQNSFSNQKQKSIPNFKTISEEKNDNSPKNIENTNNLNNDFFLVLKEILKITKTGETITKKQLIKTHNIPKNAIKLIKSITKLTEDEMYIKWDSTWWIESISDARFKNDKIKLKFHKNVLLTSGNAIGIKYQKKIYNNLIIKNKKAYITSVKGFSWKIGK
jgi:hypothetical protein